MHNQTKHKTILDVGHCGYDGPRMMQLLQSKVGVKVDTADTLASAAEKLSAGGYDVVLINRELPFEGTEGLELIRQMKSAGDPTPVMLVSDRPDAQRQAEACGAMHGFGKSQLTNCRTVSMIKKATQF
jgi:DNA-binding response OmpR family regulator